MYFEDVQIKLLLDESFTCSLLTTGNLLHKNVITVKCN